MPAEMTALEYVHALLDPANTGVFPLERVAPYFNIARSEMKDYLILPKASQPPPAEVYEKSLGYWAAGLMAISLRESELGRQFIAEGRHLLFRWVQRQLMKEESACSTK